MPEERHTEHTRVKDEHITNNETIYGFSENTQGFYDELSKKFPDLRVTSGKRDKSPSGGFSHHHEGNAFDLGKEHTDVYEYLNNTQEGLELMNKYKMGVLDETDPRNMKKTHATGPHFHYGIDSGLYANTKNRLEQFETIKPIHSFYSQNSNFDYNNINDTSNANFELQGNSNPETAVEISPEELGADPKLGAEFRLVMPNKQTADAYTHEQIIEKEKEQIKQDKLATSNNRKLLAQKQEEEQAKVEQVHKIMAKVRARDEDSLTRKPSNAVSTQTQQPLPDLNIPSSLPTLNSIFKVQ